MDEASGAIAGDCGQSAVTTAPIPEEPRSALTGHDRTGADEEQAGTDSSASSVSPAAAAGPGGCGQEASDSQAAVAGGCGQEPPSACGQAVATAATAAAVADIEPAELTRPLDVVEMRAWRAFLAASTSVAAVLNHELEADADISMHEYEILVRLSEASDHQLRMSTLAEHVSHSRSRLTHTVGRLEKAGYVERASCAADKRGVNCRLTEAGLDFLRAVAPIHLDGVRRHVVDRFTHEQLAALTELMTTTRPAEPRVGGWADRADQSLPSLPPISCEPDRSRAGLRPISAEGAGRRTASSSQTASKAGSSGASP